MAPARQRRRRRKGAAAASGPDELRGTRRAAPRLHALKAAAGRAARGAREEGALTVVPRPPNAVVALQAGVVAVGVAGSLLTEPPGPDGANGATVTAPTTLEPLPASAQVPNTPAAAAESP